LPAALTEAENEEEWRKRLLAVLLTSPAFVFLDNLRRPLTSGAISSVLTAYPAWSDRLLGHSDIARVPVRCVWTATANNPVVSDEIGRRTVPLHLDARVDRPWEHAHFVHPDLHSYIRQNRPTLVWACLTLVQAWLAVGCPAGSATMGKFEDWARTLGGILAVARVPGFLANRSEFYEHTDTRGAAVRNFIGLWWARFSEAPQDIATLLAVATGPDSDLDFGDAKTDRGVKTKFGIMLSSWRDRTYTLSSTIRVKVTIADKDTVNRRHRWRLQAQP
jgi:hypothetical protein